MPWQAAYSDTGAEITFIGVVTAQEICDANDAVYTRPYTGEFLYCIFDFTAASRVDVSAADVQRIAEQDRRYAPSHPRLAAVVVASEPYVFGMARMWEAYVESSGIHSRVARSRDAAIDWLRACGITPPAPPRISA